MGAAGVTGYARPVARALPRTWAGWARALQGGTGLALAGALALALRHPVRAESNVGATSIWLLWWPLVPFLALAAGRLWCAVCPFAGLSDAAGWLADRLHIRRRAPGRGLRAAAGVWLPLSMVLLGVAFLALGLEMSGPMTVLVVGVFAAGSVGLALAVHGRAWCRYACPLGASLGLYAAFARWRLAPAALAPGAGAAPVRCPAFLNPRRDVDPQHCQLCARCLDAGSATITGGAAPHRPLDGATAALAVALTGVLLADTVRMTPVFLSYVDVGLAVLGPAGYRVAVALLPVLGAGVAALAVLPAAWRGASWRDAAQRLVPVALAAQLGLSLQHLAGSGWPTLQGLLIELLPLPWDGHIPPSDAYTVMPALKALQLGLLAVALGVVAAKRAGRHSVHTPPVAVRAGAIGAVAGFGALFALPMSLAC
ncbi:MAG TPA: 4Fe-4S binding protein [Chloroflexota bacterium]|nr:4Fe-4S binding protein [Chloroflexota bacterium]